MYQNTAETRLASVQQHSVSCCVLYVSSYLSLFILVCGSQNPCHPIISFCLSVTVRVAAHCAQYALLPVVDEAFVHVAIVKLTLQTCEKTVSIYNSHFLYT